MSSNHFFRSEIGDTSIYETEETYDGDEMDLKAKIGHEDEDEHIENEPEEELDIMDETPGDSDDDLQLDIISFISNNPYPEVRDVREFAISLGKEPDDVIRQILILFTQMANIYNKELDLDMPEEEWHPDGFNPEFDDEAAEENEEMLASAGLTENDINNFFHS